MVEDYGGVMINGSALNIHQRLGSPSRTTDRDFSLATSFCCTWWQGQRGYVNKG